MGDTSRHTLVLFPGAWGNKNDTLVRWWFRYVIANFKGWNIVALTYSGNTLNDYVDACILQLKNIEGGNYAVCYSMGAQVARGVAQHRPELFKKVVLISGMERHGARVKTFLNALKIAFLPLIRCLVGKPLELNSVEQVKRVFISGGKPEEQEKRAISIMEHMVPEPSGAAIRLCLPGMRQRMTPFPCPVMAIVPHDDFFFPQGATYPDENVQKVSATGGHAFIVDDLRLTQHLPRVIHWLTH